MWSLTSIVCALLVTSPNTGVSNDWHALLDHTELYEDTSSSLTFQEILDPTIQAQFTPITLDGALAGLSRSNWWLKITLSPKQSRTPDPVLAFYSSWLDHIEVYQRPFSNQVQSIQIGDTLPFGTRPIDSVQLSVPLLLDPQATNTILVKIQSDGNVNLLMSVLSKERLVKDGYWIGVFMAVMVGFIAGLLIYHLFFALSTRQPGYLYFCLWAFALCAIMVILSGQGFQWIWPNTPEINDRAPFFSLLMSLGFVAFSRETLETQTHLPRFDKLGIGIQWGLGILTVIALFVPLYVGARLSNFSIFGWLWCITSSIPIAARGYRPAWYYLASFGLVSAIFINGWMHWMGLSNHSIRLLDLNQTALLMVGAMFAMGLSSFALAEHFNILKRKHREALDLSLKMEQAHASELEIEVENKTMELRKANRDLTAADTRKTNFFRSISHELRTPLTLILNPLEEERSKSPDNGNLQVASKHALRLLRLVNQLLDFQKLSAGRMDLETEPIAINDFLKFCSEGVSSAAAARQIDFSLSLSEQPIFIDGNLDALEKITFNLLSNALKYTNAGGSITLGTTTDNHKAKISIRDTGVGITKERIPHVFDIFSESTTGTSRHEEGSGLGLALVKELAESLNGAVGVASTPGEGSHFWVEFTTIEPPTLPAKDQVALKNWLVADLLPSSRMQLSEQEISFQGEVLPATDQSILVVDDIEDMRGLIANLMEKEGHEVFTASNGKEGLEKATQLKPDLIISDWMMPELSGPEMIQALQDKPDTSSIPVILLTARGDDDSKLLGTQSGASGFLSKPFSNLEVVSLVRNLLQLKEGEREIANLNKHLTENVMKRYLPEDLVDQIVSGEISIDEKPRTFVGTVLFSDLQGFTRLANEIPAATLARLLNQYFDAMVQIVFKHGGTLDKFIGDAMMILFGVPIELAPTHQVRQATQCALEMQARMKELDSIWTAEGITPPRMRIGMHQGPMIVGNFGSKRRADYTAIGPAVNLAARLESSCEPGEVLVSREIATLLQEEEFDDAGTFELKGFSEPIRCYKLIPQK